jgi:hypothetical protein
VAGRRVSNSNSNPSFLHEHTLRIFWTADSTYWVLGVGDEAGRLCGSDRSTKEESQPTNALHITVLSLCQVDRRHHTLVLLQWGGAEVRNP